MGGMGMGGMGMGGMMNPMMMVSVPSGFGTAIAHTGCGE